MTSGKLTPIDLKMFSNKFFHVLPVKLSNHYEYEKFITDNGGTIVGHPHNCIVITSLVSPTRILKHVDKSCKCVSTEYLDEVAKDSTVQIDKYVVYEREVVFTDDRLVFHAFPFVQGEKKQLVEIFNVLQKEREFNGEHFNALAYRNAIGGITGTPKSLQEAIESEFKDIAFIGPKIGHIIKEFVDTGDVQEAKQIQSTERYKAIQKMTDIWGVGEKTALGWFNKGFKSIEDVIDAKEKLNKTVQLGIKYRYDLNHKIAREMVEEIKAHLDQVCQWKAQGISVEVVGGHRRNKPLSGDIDIVLCHDKDEFCETILENSLDALKSSGVLADVYQKSMKLKYRFDTATRKNESDDLDKALTIINYKEMHRQVDLIVCTREQHPYCLLGWTGSATFERLIKMHAKRQGLTLSSSALYAGFVLTLVALAK